MKTLTLKSSLLLLLVGLSQVGFAWPWSAKEYSKVIIKEFPMSEDRMVGINNKYGKVSVETWDEEMVKIKIEIVCDANSEEDAEKIYKRIGFSFDETGEGVVCSTNIESSGGFWNWWSGDNSGDFSINYEVKMPARSHLQLTNQYGDCSVTGISKSASYDVKYGNLYTTGAIDDVNVHLRYGKAKLDDCTTMNADLEYCTAKLTQAENCKINSKYSNVMIEDAGDLVCNTKYDDYHLGQISTLINSGRYDDFHIEEISSITMNTQFADLKIGLLHHFADFVFRYGEVEIDRLSNEFRNISIEGNFAEFEIDTEVVEAFDLAFDGRYAEVDCKRDVKVINETKDGSNFSLAGYVSDKDKGGKISAHLTYGSVKIK